MPPNVVHDLVLALAGNVRIRQYDLNPPPARIAVQPIVHIVVQARRQPIHERRAGRYAVRVEVLALGLLGRQVGALQQQLRPHPLDLADLLHRLLGGAEAARPLLVHLGARRHAVDRHVEQLAGPHDAEQAVDALEYRHHHLVLVLRGGAVLGMGARVDDAVHVQVEVVELDAVRVRIGRVRRQPHAIHVHRLRRCIPQVEQTGGQTEGNRCYIFRDG